MNNLEQNKNEELLEPIEDVNPHNFFANLKQDKNWKEIKISNLFREKGRALEKNLDIIKMIANGMNFENDKRRGFKLFRRLFNKNFAKSDEKKSTFLGMLDSFINPKKKNNNKVISFSLPKKKIKINNSLHHINNTHLTNQTHDNSIKEMSRSKEKHSSFDTHYVLGIKKKPLTGMISYSSRERSLLRNAFVGKEFNLNNSNMSNIKILQKLNSSETHQLDTTPKKVNENNQSNAQNDLVSPNGNYKNPIRLFKQPEKNYSNTSQDFFTITNKYMKKLNNIFENSLDVGKTMSPNRMMTPDINDKKMIERSAKMIRNSIKLNKTAENKRKDNAKTPEPFFKRNSSDKSDKGNKKIIEFDKAANSKNINLLDANKSKLELYLKNSSSKQNECDTVVYKKKEKSSEISDFATGKYLRGEIKRLNSEIDKKGIFVRKNGQTQFISLDPNNIFRTNQVISTINTNTSVNFQNILEKKYEVDFQNNEVFGIKSHLPKHLMQHLELKKIEKQNENYHMEARKAINTLFHVKTNLYKKHNIKGDVKKH